MAPDILRSKKRTEYLATNSPEVDFALVLSRVIDAVKDNPAELRSAIYELARVKLHREGWAQNPPVDIWEMRRLTMALDTAIERVEAISTKQDELRALKSLDRLIGDLSTSEAAPATDARSVVVIDHVSGANADDNSTLPALVRRLPQTFSQLKEHSLPHWKELSWLFLQRGAAPAMRVCLVAIIAIALYATFGKSGFFGSRVTVSDNVNSSAPPTTGTTTPGAVAALPAQSGRPHADLFSAAERDRLRGFPLPSVYGIYAVSNGTLHELDALPGRVPDQRIFMSAMITKPSRTIVPDGRISFIAYRRDLATNAPDRAPVRVISKVMRSLSFNPGGPAQVSSVDDAWAIRNVQYDFRVAPLSENPEMLVLRPEASDFVLPAGRYGVVLNGLSYDFTVAGNITEPVQCLERTVAANGTFYSECRKP